MFMIALLSIFTLSITFVSNILFLTAPQSLEILLTFIISTERSLLLDIELPQGSGQVNIVKCLAKVSLYVATVTPSTSQIYVSSQVFEFCDLRHYILVVIFFYRFESNGDEIHNHHCSLLSPFKFCCLNKYIYTLYVCFID